MSRLPSTGPSLQRYLRQQARTAQRQQQSSAFNLSGTSVVAEDVTEVDGTLNVVGNLNVTGPMVVGGTLSLPNGIVDNAALASPVVPQGIYAISSTGFALSTTPVTLETVTITVPAGFTSAVVFCASRVYATNPNASDDYLYVRTYIAGAYANGFPLLTAQAYGSNVNIAPYSQVLTGLTPGGTFTVSVSAYTAYYAWAANASNAADMSGNILWFR